MSTKINPDSVILEQLDGQWQKMAMLLLWKFAKREQIVVSDAEILAFMNEFAPGIPVLFTYGQPNAIAFQLVDEAKADELAAFDKTLRGSA